MAAQNTPKSGTSGASRGCESPQIPTTQESQANNESDPNKVAVTFNFKGNPISSNKSKFKTHCLDLIKAIVGVGFEKWGEVPDAKKDDIWESLQQRFVMPAYHKERILRGVSDQWKTWKRNIRKKYLGTTLQQILALKDKVPSKLEIRLSDWNQFIEHEATQQKLEDRKRNQENRSKKRDVHLLGANSYSEVYAEWLERTRGTDDEGLEANKTNIYLYSRKDPKTGKFHPSVAEEAEKNVEIRSGQDECTQNDIDLDALIQVKGKDRKGRTRGVGSTSKTNLKAMRPIVLEHQEMKNAINQNDQKLSRMEEMFTEKMDMILSSINLLSSRSPQQYSFPYAPTSQNIQPQVSSPFSNQSAPTHAPTYTGYYHIKDVSTNSKNIAMATIKEVTLGIIVHTRAMKSPEVKLYVLEVYPGMEDEPVYLSQQGCNTTIGEFVKSFVVWPIYMLEKIM